MIQFECPSCHEKIKAPDDYGGKRGKCKKCGKDVTVPQCNQPCQPTPQSSAPNESADRHFAWSPTGILCAFVGVFAFASVCLLAFAILQPNEPIAVQANAQRPEEFEPDPNEQSSPDDNQEDMQKLEVDSNEKVDPPEEEPPKPVEEPLTEPTNNQDPLPPDQPNVLTKQQLKDIVFRCRQRHWSLESDGTFNLDESETVNVLDIVRAGGSRLGSIEVRDARIWRVLTYRPDESLSELIDIACNPDLLLDRRARAVGQLANYSSEGRAVLPALRELLSNGPESMKPAVVSAIAEIAKEDCVQQLAQLTTNKNAAISTAAIEALGNISNAEAVPELV